jgi:hypothetical protein
MEQNKQQTAVEWLADEIGYNLLMWPNNTDYWMSGLVEKAKQMEEEQHGNTWLNGQVNVGIKKTFQQYYNETYGKE